MLTILIAGVLSGVNAQQRSAFQLSIGASATIGFLAAHAEGIQTGAYGGGLGIYSCRQYKRNLFVYSGIQAAYQHIYNYRNHVIYTSNWVNGTEQTRVTLNTNITQMFVRVPLIIGYQLSESFYMGAGVEVVSLISTRTSQEALGSYVEENYPDDGEILTATIQYEYKITDEKNNAAFPRFNIAPCLVLGHRLSEAWNIQYALAYDLLSSPVVETRFNKYNTIKNQIILTFNL